MDVLALDKRRFTFQDSASSLRSSSTRRWYSRTTYSWNAGLIRMQKLNAMSLCAYVPPYLPARATIPIALVFSCHSLMLILKLLSPALL